MLRLITAFALGLTVIANVHAQPSQGQNVPPISRDKPGSSTTAPTNMYLMNDGTILLIGTFPSVAECETANSNSRYGTIGSSGTTGILICIPTR